MDQSKDPDQAASVRLPAQDPVAQGTNAAGIAAPELRSSRITATGQTGPSLQVSLQAGSGHPVCDQPGDGRDSRVGPLFSDGAVYGGAVSGGVVSDVASPGRYAPAPAVSAGPLGGKSASHGPDADPGFAARPVTAGPVSLPLATNQLVATPHQMACDPQARARALRAFSALSNGDRLDLIRLLVPAGPEGLAAGEIARRLGLSASRLSFHLAQLEQAGLLRARRVARNVFYAVDTAGLGAAISHLLNDCCGDHPEVIACCQGNVTPGPAFSDREA